MARSDSKATESVSIIKPDGTTRGPYKATFSTNIIRVFGQEFEVEDGDSLERPLADGNTEIFTVEKATFVRGMSVSLDNWRMIVRKETSLCTPGRAQTANNISRNSPGIRIGDINGQHVQAVIQSLITAIDESGASGEEKTEAKSRLQDFLSHPVVAATLGAAAGALVKAATK